MARLKVNKKFPQADTKVVLIAKLKGDSLDERVLVDFDNEWIGQINSLLTITKGVSISPPRDKGIIKIEVMADLQTGEFEGLRGYDARGEISAGFFEPPEKRRAGARIYEIERIYYFGLAAMPKHMASHPNA
ncbi:MAG: hypothetical protein HYT16_03385 [DPANN group archaeon]|nr:hypothetical protein [DPANN group archaeon]